MCDFISWIEKDGETLFLTEKDIMSSYGKEALKDERDNDLIGHGAICKYYTFTGGTEKENKNFWNGDIPKKIINAWNNGELDGMIKYMTSDDIEHVVDNAPIEFLKYIVFCKFEDYEAMKKNNDWCIRLAGMLLTHDYEAMKKDDSLDIRLVGISVTQDYEAMKKDNGWCIRLAGMSLTHDYEAMKKDDDWCICLIGMLATQDYEAKRPKILLGNH